MDDNEGNAEQVPVVLIKRAGVAGPVRLNKSTYDAKPDAYELWTGETVIAPAPTAPVTAAPEAPKPMYLVKKVGKVYFVVNEKQEEVTAPGIEAGGYSDEAAAWAAAAEISKKA